MPRWIAKDVVPNASMDLWGRRTGVRVFAIWDIPINEGTARLIAQQLNNNPDSIIRDDGIGGSNFPMPPIGDPWSIDANAENYAQMYLERYDVQIQGQEIIATAYYSSDFDTKSLEMDWSPQVVSVPYAVKVATGIAFAGAGGGSTYSWQLQSWNVPIGFARMAVSGKVHMSSMAAVDLLISNSVNKLFYLTILKQASQTMPFAGPVKVWKFEGAQASEMGPDFMQVRYSFISDPGNQLIQWPVEMMATGDDARFALPPVRQSAFQNNMLLDWVRPPFHEIKCLPPVYPAGQTPDGRNPLPPTFITLPTSRGFYGESNTQNIPSISLPGIGTFPFSTRAYR